MCKKFVFNVKLWGIIWGILPSYCLAASEVDVDMSDVSPPVKASVKILPSSSIVSSSPKAFSLSAEEASAMKFTPQAGSVDSIEKDLKNRVFKWAKELPKVEKAIEGDKPSQVYVGHLYRMAVINPSEDKALTEKSLQWLLHSLRDDDGNGDAEVELFSLYLHQKGDKIRAEQWLKKALAKGSEQAKEYFKSSSGEIE